MTGGGNYQLIASYLNLFPSGHILEPGNTNFSRIVHVICFSGSQRFVIFLNCIFSFIKYSRKRRPTLPPANVFPVNEKTNPYRENKSLSEKPILIGKTNPYRENQSLSEKPILIGKTNPYWENQSLSEKPILIGKTNPYRENQSLSGKQILC